MSFDAHSNLGFAFIAVAPVPANTGTQLDVAAGQGALFPAAPFNCTVWPSGVNPIASNAEIVRVTAVVGDTLTIVRAQEGTAPINIAAGYQIANTTSVKVFTDIENAIAISAGTQNAQGPFTFADGGGVTFGMDNGTVTASVTPGGGGGVALSAGANSQSTGTVVFSNSNGLSFGLDGAGVLTASHNGITSQSNPAFSASGGSSTFQTLNFANSNGFTFSNSNGSVIGSYTVPAVPAQSTQPVAASATNGSFLFSTLGFSNANGVTFGTSAGSIITASVGAGVAAGSLAAGGSTMALGQVVFSNSNGVSFSLNGSTVTASHNGLTSQSNQNVTASNGGFAFQTLSFSNANGISFGTSAGSAIFASHNGITSESVQPVAASASNGSFLFSTLGFSNANGVTFGTSAGSIITASVGTAAAGAGSLLYFEAAQPASTGSGAIGQSGALTPFLLPMSMSVSYARYMVSMATSSTTLATLNSASATANGSVAMSFSAVLYTIGTGASSTVMSSVASGSGGWTFANSISVTNSSQYTITQALSYLFAGTTSLLSTSYATSLSNYALSTTAYVGFTNVRWLDIPFATSLSAGNYWMAFHMSSTTNTAGAITGISRGLMYPATQFSINSPDFPQFNMGNTATFGAAFFYAGIFSTVGLGTLASIPVSIITGGGSNRKPYLQLLAQQ